MATMLPHRPRIADRSANFPCSLVALYIISNQAESCRTPTRHINLETLAKFSAVGYCIAIRFTRYITTCIRCMVVLVNRFDSFDTHDNFLQDNICGFPRHRIFSGVSTGNHPVIVRWVLEWSIYSKYNSHSIVDVTATKSAEIFSKDIIIIVFFHSKIGASWAMFNLQICFN